MAAALVGGVVTWDSLLNSKGAWAILIWYGGIIGLADGLAKAKFFDGMAKLIASNLNFSGYDPVVKEEAIAKQEMTEQDCFNVVFAKIGILR